MVTRAITELANHKQSLVLSSGGGGNRKHRISSRIRQLRGITGNRIPSYRKQKTAKSMFGKTFCQLAKSERRRRREGRTWESYPPPGPWAAWPARFWRAHGTRTRAAWHAPCCNCWHLQVSNRDPLPHDFCLRRGRGRITKARSTRDQAKRNRR